MTPRRLLPLTKRLSSLFVSLNLVDIIGKLDRYVNQSLSVTPT